MANDTVNIGGAGLTHARVYWGVTGIRDTRPTWGGQLAQVTIEGEARGSTQGGQIFRQEIRRAMREMGIKVASSG